MLIHAMNVSGRCLQTLRHVSGLGRLRYSRYAKLDLATVGYKTHYHGLGAPWLGAASGLHPHGSWVSEDHCSRKLFRSCKVLNLMNLNWCHLVSKFSCFQCRMRAFFRNCVRSISWSTSHVSSHLWILTVSQSHGTSTCRLQSGYFSTMKRH